ncbi:MAG: hypothetical protein KF895_03280 [Parvibaculum sp.]|nr:hypothetical protein [Parvibaculum sp.]
MTKPDANAPLDCPLCGEPSEISNTQHGRRDSCQRCGVHSWGGKPMVHARKQQGAPPPLSSKSWDASASK